MNTFHLFEKFVKAPLTPEEVAKAKSPEGLTSRSVYSIRSLRVGGFGLFRGAIEIARRVGPFFWLDSYALQHNLRESTRVRIRGIVVPCLRDEYGRPALLHKLLASQASPPESPLAGTAGIHEVNCLPYDNWGVAYSREFTLSQLMYRSDGCSPIATFAGEHWSFDA